MFKKEYAENLKVALDALVTGDHIEIVKASGSAVSGFVTTVIAGDDGESTIIFKDWSEGTLKPGDVVRKYVAPPEETYKVGEVVLGQNYPRPYLIVSVGEGRFRLLHQEDSTIIGVAVKPKDLSNITKGELAASGYLLTKAS